MTKQIQKGGDNSTNIQAGEVHVIQGITYTEARTIALDVFKSNFLSMSEQAATIARNRAEEITEQFLRKLQSEHEKGVQNAQDPDFQHALFTVQKEYARTGDKQLGDLLVDLLVDRTKHDKRSILQIVLNESLSVAPKLTTDQLAVLSTVFILRYTINYGIKSLDTLSKYLDTYISPFSDLLSKNAACYQHLEYAGCGSISIGEVNLGELLRNKYAGVFSKGFDVGELQSRQINIAPTSEIFTVCLHDKNKLQVNSMSEQVLRDKARELNLSEEETNKLVGLNNSYMMNANEIRQYLSILRPYMEKIFDVWGSSYMRNLKLTSVGIAIGHANVKRQIGEFTDLSIWIN